MFENAGYSINAQPADLDEAAIKVKMRAAGARPENIAEELAAKKAEIISANTNNLVIGSDQILVCEGMLFDKAENMKAAKEKLFALQGRPHQLISAAVVFENGKPVWGTTREATLYMRALTEDEIDYYLDLEGEAVLSSVGCYFLEGRGANLFTRVDGDYFTVLGFPLLDVLGYLRERSII